MFFLLWLVWTIADATRQIIYAKFVPAFLGKYGKLKKSLLRWNQSFSVAFP